MALLGMHRRRQYLGLHESLVEPSPLPHLAHAIPPSSGLAAQPALSAEQDQHRHSDLILARSRHPVSAMATSSSARSSCTTWATPLAPAAAKPYI